MLEREVRIGDIVLIKGRVIKTQNGCVIYSAIDCNTPGGHFQCYTSRVHEIVAAPWEPKIGDTVFHTSRTTRYGTSGYHGLTLLHVHQVGDDDRKWAVVAFSGDMPRSVYYEDLRETYAECVD